MGGAMTRIMPSIYVGGIASAKAKSQLDANNVTHVCSVIHYKFLAPCEKHQFFMAADNPTENLSKYFEEACLFIHEARVSGGAALIHCACGVSRSVTITLAYMMTITGLPLKQAFKAIQGARHCACPNHGFVDQLLEFEKSDGPARLKAKLIERFGDWPAEKYEQDMTELKQHIATQEYYIEHGYYENEQPIPQQQQEQNPSSDSNDHVCQPTLPSSFMTYHVQRVPTLEEIIGNSSSLTSNDVNTTKS